MKAILKIFAFFVIFMVTVSAGEWPVEIRFSGFHQNVFDMKSAADYGYYNNHAYDPAMVYFPRIKNDGFGFSYLGWPDSIDAGYGIEGEIRYVAGELFRIGFQVGYDVMRLYQWDVLDDWNWSYWEDTYIEFLPGITVDEANKTFRYNYIINDAGNAVPNDSMQFSAKFIPMQHLKELRLGTSFSYRLPVTEKIDAQFGMDFGVNLFSRTLEMNEKWIKRFKLDTTSTAKYDYEYKLNLTHFAPSKNGARFYLAPNIAMVYHFNRVFDFEFNYRFLQYVDRKYTKPVENFFRFSKNSEKWFPLYSKYQLNLGIVFKY